MACSEAQTGIFRWDGRTCRAVSLEEIVPVSSRSGRSWRWERTVKPKKSWGKPGPAGGYRPLSAFFAGESVVAVEPRNITAWTDSGRKLQSAVRRFRMFRIDDTDSAASQKS
ncbi:hypothetical protein CIHG_03351 [Coccidioides immitis H538.4]|uniref:Uncharacterized protein n=1 Tax=Coccidioides immitis H538.4 TaxID=396776 RepID=A0A0J8UES4_COCIT|nr:hypothetical protein CIHG_03351 [Coccidioides immitis H538.4]